jgi:hypothetical protein
MMDTMESRQITAEEVGRAVYGWSQDQLADISGLTTRTIQRLGSDERSSVHTRPAVGYVFRFEDPDWLSKPLAPVPTRSSSVSPHGPKCSATATSWRGWPRRFGRPGSVSAPRSVRPRSPARVEAGAVGQHTLRSSRPGREPPRI